METKKYAISDVEAIANFIMEKGVYHDGDSDSPPGYKCGMCNGYIPTNRYEHRNAKSISVETEKSFKHSSGCLILIAQEIY